jgi:hypothetical protein
VDQSKLVEVVVVDDVAQWKLELVEETLVDQIHLVAEVEACQSHQLVVVAVDLPDLLAGLLVVVVEEVLIVLVVVVVAILLLQLAVAVAGRIVPVVAEVGVQ